MFGKLQIRRHAAFSPHTVAAEGNHRFSESLIPPDVGPELLSNALGGFDLSEYDIDGPLPDVPDNLGVNSQTSFANVLCWAREERLTIRQLYERYASARDQRTLIGSPGRSPMIWLNGFSRLVSTAF
jgi:alkanesulfonate monooxygenase